jgi:competence protein ComEC
MKYFSRAPLIRLLLPLLGGILLAIHLPFIVPYLSWIILALLSSYALIVLFTSFGGAFKYRPFIGIWINIILFFAGYQITINHNHTFLPNHFSKIEKGDVFLAFVAEQLQEKEKSVKTVLEVSAVKVGEEWQPAGGKIMAYLRKEEKAHALRVNDKIVFQSKVSEVAGPGNPGEFNYKKYLSYHQVFHQVFIDSTNWALAGRKPSFSILRAAQEARLALLGYFKKYNIEGEEYAVASALVLGFKDEIGQELIQAYSGAGAMHVLAVSGLHVGIIYLVLNSFLKFLDKKRYGRFLKALLLIAMLWAYALITGLSPSVMRAATMFSIVIIGTATGKNSSIYNSLAGSAFILLLFNPYLIVEVGFQLSYLAVLGIVYIQPKIYQWLNPANFILKWVWGITAVSLAAQLATFPLGILYFHQFPNYFLFSNLIVIPAATIILSSGLILLLFAGIAEMFSGFTLIVEWLAYLFHKVVLFLNFIVTWIEKLPYSITDWLYISDLQVWLIYASIISLLAYFASIRGKYLVLACAILAFFLIEETHKEWRINQSRKIFFYNVKGHTAIDFVDGKKNYFLSDLSITESYSTFLFNIRNNWIRHSLKDFKLLPKDSVSLKENELAIFNGFARFGNKIIFSPGPDKEDYPELETKIPLDALVISRQCNWWDIEKYLKAFEIRQVIVDSSNPVGRARKIREKYEALGIKVHSTADLGAYVLSD